MSNHAPTIVIKFTVTADVWKVQVLIPGNKPNGKVYRSEIKSRGPGMYSGPGLADGLPEFVLEAVQAMDLTGFVRHLIGEDD